MSRKKLFCNFSLSPKQPDGVCEPWSVPYNKLVNFMLLLPEPSLLGHIQYLRAFFMLKSERNFSRRVDESLPAAIISASVERVHLRLFPQNASCNPVLQLKFPCNLLECKLAATVQHMKILALQENKCAFTAYDHLTPVTTVVHCEIFNMIVTLY